MKPAKHIPHMRPAGRIPPMPGELTATPIFLLKEILSFVIVLLVACAVVTIAYYCTRR